MTDSRLRWPGPTGARGRGLLERMNYLLSSEVGLPKAELVDRLTAIIAAAFHPGHQGCTS